MSKNSVMARLRAANPDRIVETYNEQLREFIVSLTPEWRTADEPVSLRQRLFGFSDPARWARLRSAIAAGGTATAAIAVALAVFFSGSGRDVAQAFPALDTTSLPTPAALQESLRIYGVGPQSDGLNLASGHVVDTPLGNGYVLTSPDDGFICGGAPGSSGAEWGASCARTTLATSSGTPLTEYDYDATTGSARVVALLPEGATATLQTDGDQARQISLSDGLLAVEISSPTQIAVTVNGRTAIEQLSPQDAPRADITATPEPDGASSTAAGRSASTTP